MTFDDALDRLIDKNEGGYSFNAADPGGETMWGITARVARANGYLGDMKVLPRATAGAIYKARYWDSVQADQLPETVRFDLFDAAVNSGVSQAVRWLQQAAGVKDDGVIGSMTLAAVHGIHPLLLVILFTGERLDLMTSLPTWGSFGRGWARRIAANLKAHAGEKDDS
jgi:lysozyme family protein